MPYALFYALFITKKVCCRGAGHARGGSHLLPRTTGDYTEDHIKITADHLKLKPGIANINSTNSNTVNVRSNSNSTY